MVEDFDPLTYYRNALNMLKNVLRVLIDKL